MPVVVPPVDPISGTTTDATSYDGRIRAIDDPAFGGVRIKIDYSADLPSWSHPFRCTLYRENADGSVHTVRGGDPYVNYAGAGWLYDAEAPLGQPVSYYAVPVDASGTLGVKSGAASIMTTAPSGGFRDPDMWLINLEDPAKSVQARGTATLAGNYNGRSDKQIVLGQPYPVVTPDARNGLTTQISVLTVGEQEFAAMQELLKQSIIMRKSSLWERPDGYFVVDDVSYSAATAVTGRGIYVWQLGLTEVGRPATYGQTVVVPGFSFGDYLEKFPTFADVPELPFDAVIGGNLLDVYTAEGETGATGLNGWDNINPNTLIARVSKPSSPVYRGNYSRRLTSVTSGQMGAITSLAYQVTSPSTVHTYKAWLYSTLGLTVNLGVDWQNGAGTTIASDSLAAQNKTVTLTPSIWTQVTLRTKPVPDAAWVKAWMRVSVTAGGQVAYFDDVSLENI